VTQVSKHAGIKIHSQASFESFTPAKAESPTESSPSVAPGHSGQVDEPNSRWKRSFCPGGGPDKIERQHNKASSRPVSESNCCWTKNRPNRKSGLLVAYDQYDGGRRERES
jgi:hypothetical protein